MRGLLSMLSPALPLLAVVMALVPAGALGAADVIGNSGNEFDKATYYADEGELVQYKHSGRAPHNVVSKQLSGAEPLFESATISEGTTPVNGTELLPPGTYPFVCTIHSGMEAELVIRATAPPPPSGEPPPPSGEPPPPSGDPSPPDGSTPSEDTTLDGSAKAKRKQKQRGRRIVVKVKVKASEDLDAKGTGRVKVKRESYKLKPKARSVDEGEEKTLKLKPKKKQANKITKALKKGKKAQAKVTVKLSDEAANEETIKLTVEMKR